MARPTRDAIEAFMSITGASQSLALQRLEDHGGNLSEAVNAHFGELERNTVNPTSGASPRYSNVDGSCQAQPRQRGLSSLFSAARSFRPSLLLDPHYRRDLLNQIGGPAFASSPPSRAPYTGEVTGFPAESTWRNDQPHPGFDHAIGNDARILSIRGSEFGGNTNRDHESHLYGTDIEQQMIEAAIEASKKDFEDGHHNKKHFSSSNPSGTGLPKEILQQEDEELAHAISASLKTEELEKAMREQVVEIERQLGAYDSGKESEVTEKSRWKLGSSSVQRRSEDVKQKQPMDHKPVHENHLQRVEDSPNPRKQEHQSGSAVKESFLPVEPSLENENAVTVVVRMPDGSRHGRLFLKSDKLQYLFNFIDLSGAIKPGTYRVVRPYPRHAFSVDNSSSSFEDLGLSSKQEVLFLEFI